MKKLLIPMMLMALICLVAGCASKTEAEMMPTTSPQAPLTPGMEDEGLLDDVTPDLSAPMTSAGPMGGTVNTMRGVTTAARARDAVEKIEEELERLSEVDEAQVLVAGTTAVVALDFDAQYQSGVTARVEKMVKERIDSVVSGVENVIVTDDNTIADALEKLGDRLDGAADMTDLEAELEKLVDRVKNAA